MSIEIVFVDGLRTSYCDAFFDFLPISDNWAIYDSYHNLVSVFPKSKVRSINYV